MIAHGGHRSQGAALAGSRHIRGNDASPEPVHANVRQYHLHQGEITMSTNYGVSNALIDIIAAPGKALDEVKTRVSWLWAPLGITLVLTIAAVVSYNLWVDFDWLVEETIRTALPPGSDPAAAAPIRSFMKPAVMIVSGVAGVIGVTLFIYLLQSLYLHLVNKAAGDPSLSFGQWFAFSAWTAFPGVFGAVAMFVVMLLAENNQVGQAELSPLSLQSLFIHAEPTSPWFIWGSSLQLTNFWMLALMTIGFMRWTGSSLLKSALIACAPWVLLFGIWGVIAAMRA